MRVVLLNPVMRDGTQTLRIGRCQGKVLVGMWPNIEYGYLGAALLADGFDVVLLDANHDRLSFGAMLARVATLRPDVLFVLSISPALADDLAVAERLAPALPDTRFVYWGTHATARPGDYLCSPRHLVLRREVDVAGLELAQALRDGAHAFDDVPGASWLDGEAPRHAPDRPFLVDLDRLPMASHALMGTGRHTAADTRQPFALVKTSRGCPHRCVFCTVHCFHGARWRSRSPESVVDEVRFVRGRTGIRDFFFQSDLFSGSRPWTVELCERLLAENLDIRWFSNSRVDTLDADLLALLVRAGCRLLAMGVESGSDTVLRAIGKGATRAQGLSTIAAMREAGIPSLTYYVLGLPGETGETIEETIDFIRRARPDYAHFYTPTPYPGSRLYHELGLDSAADEGRIDWGAFFHGLSLDFLSPGVTPRQVRRALYRLHLLMYGDPRRIARELASIRSLGALRGRALTVYYMLRNYLVGR